MNAPSERPGPKVVAIGGGHGLSASLRALRSFAGELTAVVSVADDGGSTGRLRQMGERPAPGDLRKSLVALAEHDSMLVRALEHRFEYGDLEGHALGNLMIMAFDAVANDLVAALDELGSLIGAVGRVLPATRHPVRLVGRTEGGETVIGQVEVMGTVGVSSVELDPVDPPAPTAVLGAIEAADLIVLGPGSLYTSVLAATAVPAIRVAVQARSDRLVYVCNLSPQAGETAGYGLAEHVAALTRHGLEPAAVLFDPEGTVSPASVPRLVERRLAVDATAAHDPELLAVALQEILDSW